MIHRDTIKLADFGRSCIKGSKCDNTEVWGVLPYMDPKILNDNSKGYKLTEKSDIYSLGVVFWELTSCSPPFGFDDNLERVQITQITLKILNGKRESRIRDVNEKFATIYEGKHKMIL